MLLIRNVHVTVVDAILWHWADFASKSGRAVSLVAGSSQIKGPVGVAPKSLDKFQILVMDCAVRCRRDSKVDLPHASLRILKMHQAASLWNHIDFHPEPCCICSRDIFLDSDRVRKCALCLHTFHNRCSVL